eukprot:47000-Prorocentrum_minimum.AAC.1
MSQVPLAMVDARLRAAPGPRLSCLAKCHPLAANLSSISSKYRIASGCVDPSSTTTTSTFVYSCARRRDVRGGTMGVRGDLQGGLRASVGGSKGGGMVK